ncbi:MAG: exo-alpha-sialidase [Bacteroidota bacterium]
MKNLQRVFVLLFLYSFPLYGQSSGVIRLTERRAIELDAVQTKKNTFLATVMTTGLETAPIDSETLIFRSSDMGKSWNTVFVLSATSKFEQNADPVITMDSIGNIYLVLMRIDRKTSIPNAQLWCYKSTDDGLTWNLAGKPFSDETGFTDYPQIYAEGNGRLFISYMMRDKTTSSFLINFSKSDDGGGSWTAPELLPSVSNSKWYVGADISQSADNTLHIAYGEYSGSFIYHTFSNDNGQTWSDLHTIKGLGSFLINKVVSNKDLNHLGILSHEPHNVQTPVYFSSSNDNGNTWNTKKVINSAAYAEGVLDDKGIYHLIYNQIDSSNFNLGYIFSEDKGQTFSKPIILYSIPKSNIKYSSGEYQSLILASDGMFHLTFVDYGDTLKAKQIIFPPKMGSGVSSPALSTLPLIYPLPANDVLHIKLDETENLCSYQILDMTGKTIAAGHSSSGAFTVNIAHIPTGTFILNLNINNRIVVNKFIKN